MIWLSFLSMRLDIHHRQYNALRMNHPALLSEIWRSQISLNNAGWFISYHLLASSRSNTVTLHETGKIVNPVVSLRYSMAAVLVGSAMAMVRQW